MAEGAKRFGNLPRFSSIVVHDNTVYLAGQVSQLVEGDITAQSEDVFAKIDALLEEAGCSRDSIISAQIWLADMDDYAAMNEAWDKWLDGRAKPVRVCVEARMAKPHYKIEVLAIAILNDA
ncbi:RidA family protein [uncultured Nitratireductor sp.]|uniref:RidA family protein n=1 Tax=uncultured Nitratireductor sp. TaxID=520953 RepID=UPI002637FBFD|nr:RidA family protein [uncultured Nitratireductor sp.]